MIELTIIFMILLFSSISFLLIESGINIYKLATCTVPYRYKRRHKE